jgi:hypothetical protein
VHVSGQYPLWGALTVSDDTDADFTLSARYIAIDPSGFVQLEKVDGISCCAATSKRRGVVSHCTADKYYLSLLLSLSLCVCVP